MGQPRGYNLATQSRRWQACRQHTVKAHKAAKRVGKIVDTSTGQKSEKTKVWKP
jgi:hypothetical protein